MIFSNNHNLLHKLYYKKLIKNCNSSIVNNLKREII